MKGIITFFAGLYLLFVAGCATGPTEQTDVMYQLATELTRLAAPVEATVRYDNPPAAMSDQELLKKATEYDPALLTPFKDYKVLVLRGHRHAVLLVCTQDGKALLEDAGCTGQLESHRWQGQDRRCEFTLDINQVCN